MHFVVDAAWLISRQSTIFSSCTMALQSHTIEPFFPFFSSARHSQLHGSMKLGYCFRYQCRLIDPILSSRAWANISACVHKYAGQEILYLPFSRKKSRSRNRDLTNQQRKESITMYRQISPYVGCWVQATNLCYYPMTLRITSLFKKKTPWRGDGNVPRSIWRLFSFVLFVNLVICRRPYSYKADIRMWRE